MGVLGEIVRVFVIVTSINELKNINLFKNKMMNYECKVLIIDEGDEKIRKRNNKLLNGMEHDYFGPKERKKFFKDNFGSVWRTYYSQVVPQRCSAESSVGLMMAYKEKPDLVLMLDDDVFPVNENDDIIGGHFNVLNKTSATLVSSENKWYNPIENIQLNVNQKIFPRGYPYAKDTRKESYIWKDSHAPTIFNMGLWINYPDLDAITVLTSSGLDGRGDILGVNIKREKIIVAKGTYFPVCIMNVGFIPKIIPAYYQLYMNYLGIDRWNDIWSGLFLKKIADHLNDSISLGMPAISHKRTPRNVFRDIKKELDGMCIHENLLQLVDSIDLSGNSYFDCYKSLIESIEKKIPVAFSNKTYLNFMERQIIAMRLWLEALEKID
jgi:hypothetical protein